MSCSVRCLNFLKRVTKSFTGLRYDYYLSCQNEDEILLLEEWDTAEHQRIHMEQEHMKRLRVIKDDCIADTQLHKD